MAVVLGINAKIYYSEILDSSTLAKKSSDPNPSAPFPSTGTALDAANSNDPMAVMDNVRSVSLSLEKNVADITTRSGNGWRQVVGVLKDGSVTFQMIWDTSDPSFANMSYAFFNDMPIYLAVLDGDANSAVTGTRIQGLYSPFSVTNLSRNEDLEEALLADVTVQPTFVTGKPQEWVDRTIA